MLSQYESVEISFFFFNDTATTEIYTLSLHDALPIFLGTKTSPPCIRSSEVMTKRTACSSVIQKRVMRSSVIVDRKSTRLNSSHANISYAVFCLKKKTTKYILFR